MTTATVPVIERSTPALPVVLPVVIEECFDCGAFAPVERWEDDTGAGVMLCLDRQACRRRQLGNCEECITLDRRCWSCRHPQLAGW